jgi:hypothetical protein
MAFPGKASRYPVSDPNFISGSYLVFTRSRFTFSFTFHNDLQLKYESAASALWSLCAWLDHHYPGPLFTIQSTKALEAVAERWLRRFNAGRTFWGANHHHILMDEEMEEDSIVILQWPDDSSDLVYGVWGLLCELRKEAPVFYKVGHSTLT